MPHLSRLAPPATGRTMLVRQRLLGRLRARWYMPVTVVAAPAGYGKTTLLAQALAANEAAPLGIDCWLACNPADDAASALGAGLCEAVGAAPPAPGATRSDVAAAVSGAVWRRSPQQVALVIDDVHEIGRGSEGAALLAAVIGALPANGHVVVSGRGQPPLPLARLDLAGRVARLDDAELAFTDDELADFAALRGVPGASLAGSGGWPAMAELSASGPPGVAAAYVGEEVLGSLDPERRRALAQLAHLGPFDDDLATAVLGITPTDLDEVLAGLPLVSSLPGGERSLHAIWRPLLAADVDPAALADLRRQAAAHVRARGDPAAAVRLLLDAATPGGGSDELAAAVVDALGAVHPPVPRDVLADWLARVPTAIRTGPSGQLLTAVVAVDEDPAASGPRLEAAADAFRAAGDQLGELACLVQLGQLGSWTEDVAVLAPVAARLFALEAAGCKEATALACLARALLFDIQNDSRGALAELDHIPTGALNDVWQGIVDWFRSVSVMHLGDARAALEAAEAALGHPGALHLPLAEGARLQALWYLGRGAELRESFPALVESLAAAGHRNFTALAAAQCAIVLAHLGEADRAGGYLAQARATAASPGRPLVDTNLALGGTSLALARGDEATATTHIEEVLARQPLWQGHSAAPQQRSLALFYVLVPATRPVWDAMDLGTAFVPARDLARALVAVRARGRLPADTPPLPPAAVALAHLDARWVAEVAVAASATGRDDGWAVLGDAWSILRPAVARLADAPGPLQRAARTALHRLAVPPAGRLELRLLGPIELSRDGVAISAPDWRRERVRMLLAYLALHRSASREQVGDDLWPALDTEAQSRNLRVTLSYLLRMLEPDRPARGASFFVHQQGDRLLLRGEGSLEVDVWAFDDHARRAADANDRGVPTAALDHALRAVELWRGEATELVSQPWALAPLEERGLRFAALATRAGELLLAQGNPEAARALAERALAVDPWMEAPHRLVVAANHALGDDLAARRALTRYRDAVREIGLDPDEATLMIERLLDHGGTRSG